MDSNELQAFMAENPSAAAFVDAIAAGADPHKALADSFGAEEAPKPQAATDQAPLYVTLGTDLDIDAEPDDEAILNFPAVSVWD